MLKQAIETLADSVKSELKSLKRNLQKQSQEVTMVAQCFKEVREEMGEAQRMREQDKKEENSEDKMY